MANQIVSKQLTTGWTVYAVIKNLDGDVWDATLAASTFTAINTITWDPDAVTAMAEQGSTAQYRVAIPAALPAGVYEFSIRRQAGGSPAITDVEQELQRWYWDGTDKHDSALYQTAIDDEPVPTERTFKLKQTPDEGLVGEAVKSVHLAGDPTIAVDFSVDMPVNGRISQVGTPTIAAGTAGGLTFTTGKDKNLAKLRIATVTAGLYTVRVPVTYSTGATSAGTIQFRVVE